MYPNPKFEILAALSNYLGFELCLAQHLQCIKEAHLLRSRRECFPLWPEGTGRKLNPLPANGDSPDLACSSQDVSAGSHFFIQV